MTKEIYEKIKAMKNVQKSFKDEMMRSLIDIIDTGLNRHKSDVVQVMFDKPIVVLSSFQRAYCEKGLGVKILNGVSLVKHGGENYLSTINSEGAEETSLECEDILVILDIVKAVEEVIKNE